MTQEDKNLLLQDLCARLPYGVKCHFKYGSAEDDITLGCIDKNVARFEYGWYGRFHVSIDANYIKPYLRPMSSMTREELFEVKNIIDKGVEICDVFINIVDSSIKRLSYAEIQAVFDWLNAHHFDYRGLIEKGLAIEVTKENNPYEN